MNGQQNIKKRSNVLIMI